VKDEVEAKEAHRGIWQGKFEIPAEWRKDKKGLKNATAVGSKNQSNQGDHNSYSTYRDPAPRCLSPMGLKHIPGIGH